MGTGKLLPSKGGFVCVFFLSWASSVGDGGKDGDLCPVRSGREKGWGVFSRDGGFGGGGGCVSFCWLGGLEIAFWTSSSSWLGLAFFCVCECPGGGGVFGAPSGLLAALFLLCACGPFSSVLVCVLDVGVSLCDRGGVS